MQRRKFITGTVSLGVTSLYSTVSHAEELWSLVTKEEFDNELSLPKTRGLHPSQPKTTAGGPIISLRQPDQSKPIQPPVTVRIAFRAQGSAKIDVKSFHALYGSSRIDITQRLLDHAKLNESGLTASNAQLPAGQHTVTLTIADNLQRMGALTVHFTVV